VDSGGRVTRTRAGARGPVTPAGAMDVALRYLSRRARTVREMRTHLAARRYDPAEVDRTVRNLERLGYLDDTAFAVRYAAWAAAEKPMGRRRIAADLARRGVAMDVIDRALDDALGAEEEASALARALQKATKGVTAPADDRARRRLAAYLVRRGFRPPQAMRAVEEWARTGSGADEGEVFEE